MQFYMQLTTQLQSVLCGSSVRQDGWSCQGLTYRASIDVRLLDHWPLDRDTRHIRDEFNFFRSQELRAISVVRTVHVTHEPVRSRSRVRKRVRGFLGVILMFVSDHLLSLP